LNFNDQTKGKLGFLENQQVQEKLKCKNFSNQFAAKILKIYKKEDQLNELLQENALRASRAATEKNKRALEELQNVADKINKDELSKTFGGLGKKSKKVVNVI